MDIRDQRTKWRWAHCLDFQSSHFLSGVCSKRKFLLLRRGYPANVLPRHRKQKYTEHNEDDTTSGVNCDESFSSLIKNGLLGTFHAMSKEHLHRYCDELAFRWDTWKLNDGERLTFDQYVCRK